MVSITIDDRRIQVPEGTTILEAAKMCNISIPHLCYLKGINEIGACRVCVVEVEGLNRLITACNNVVEEGMVIHTNSPKVREARCVNVKLILSQHDVSCTTCMRNGNCSLQAVANELGILDMPYERELPKAEWPEDFPLVRNAEKCIQCMRCVQICDKIQSIHVWDVTHHGTRTTVDVAHNRKFEEADCVYCGQCVTQCPVGALTERDDTEKVFKALADKEKITVVQIAPAVRAAWGESLGLSREFATVKRLVAALRRMGFNYIVDTDFAADLTIMEEANEFLERLKNKETAKFPMFTSCCPGWVRFLKIQYPDMVDNLSTAKSPQQMFGAVIKTYYAKLLNVDPSKIYSVSIMPCTAKKYEAGLSAMDAAGTGHDVDVVLTTREIDRMIKAMGIDVHSLEEEEFDQPLGVGSGAGVIFGVTGGVMEAALRTAYYLVTGKNPDPDAFKDVRGKEGWRESSFDLAGNKIKIAVANGLGNARKLLEAVRNGEVQYHFVEIMACPGGCSGGGGQPIWEGQNLALERGKTLYELDKANKIRFSHENPSIIKCYEEYLGKPLSHRSHELLHTNQNEW